MKKIKFLTLLIYHFLSRYLKRGLPSMGLFLLGLVIIFLLVKFILPNLYHPALSEGFVGIYNQNGLPPTVTNLLSSPLVSLDSSGKPQPNIAASWQVNNNATVYTFKLKDSVRWNDGSLVKSSDIKFNLPDVEVSYPDDQTIEFKLVDSFSPFPTLLTTPVFKNNTLTGLGKYILNFQEKSREVVTKLVLTPNSDKSLPVVTIRFYPDEKAGKTAFELGEIDSLIGIPEDNELKNYPNIKNKKITIFNKVAVILYNTKDPILSKDTRKALSFATPVPKGEDLAKSPISPFSWAYNSEVREYLGKKESVSTYLDKVKIEKDKPIILTTNPSLSSLGESIIQSWKDAKIPAVLRIESGLSQNFQALLMIQTLPLDPDQYAIWHSTQSKTNLTKYSSPRIDKDLEDARKTGDIEKRKEKYLDFQKVLLDDAPATFLYFPKLNIFYRGKMEQNLNKVLPLQMHNI